MIIKLIATPKGTPASINPINAGIEEQEQNGVIAPNIEANKCARNFGCLSMNCFNLLLSI